jgi:hypothetical protein
MCLKTSKFNLVKSMMSQRKWIKISVKTVFCATGSLLGGYAGKEFGLAIGGLLADGVIDFVADTTTEMISERLGGLLGSLAGSYITEELAEELLPDEEGNPSTGFSQYS